MKARAISVALLMRATPQQLDAIVTKVEEQEK
jgi:hypothetical protein